MHLDMPTISAVYHLGDRHPRALAGVRVVAGSLQRADRMVGRRTARHVGRHRSRCHRLDREQRQRQCVRSSRHDPFDRHHVDGRPAVRRPRFPRCSGSWCGRLPFCLRTLPACLTRLTNASSWSAPRWRDCASAAAVEFGRDPRERLSSRWPAVICPDRHRRRLCDVAAAHSSRCPSATPHWSSTAAGFPMSFS